VVIINHYEPVVNTNGPYDQAKHTGRIEWVSAKRKQRRVNAIQMSWDVYHQLVVPPGKRNRKVAAFITINKTLVYGGYIYNSLYLLWLKLTNWFLENWL